MLIPSRRLKVSACIQRLRLQLIEINQEWDHASCITCRSEMLSRSRFGCHLKRGLVCIPSLKLQTAAFSDPERSVQEVCRVSSACAVAKELDATLCCIWKACGTKKHTTDLAMGAGWEALRATAGPDTPYDTYSMALLGHHTRPFSAITYMLPQERLGVGCQLKCLYRSRPSSEMGAGVPLLSPSQQVKI